MSGDTEILKQAETVLAHRFQSTAGPARESSRLNGMLLPAEARSRMPLTKDRYVIKENPELVAWEREVRKFLRNLSPRHGHRVAAVMIFEWATGLNVADLVAEGHGPNADLRKLNFLLGQYFGTPYKTQIAGRPIGKAYKVPPGWLVRDHRPKTMELYAEWLNKTLSP